MHILRIDEVSADRVLIKSPIHVFDSLRDRFLVQNFIWIFIDHGGMNGVSLAHQLIDIVESPEKALAASADYTIM